jgi:hypothetical protein
MTSPTNGSELLKKIQDPVFISSIFFLINTDFFDNWLKDMIPSLRTSSEMFSTLIKTIVFAIMYLAYCYFMKKSPF